MHRGHEKAHFLGKLFAYALDPRQQLPALVTVNQGNQAIAHLQANHVHRGDIVPTQFLDLLSLLRWQQLLLALHFLDFIFL